MSKRDDLDARKGIRDPWRMHTADREVDPEDASPTGMAGSKHPLDADLLPHTEYVFRCPRSAGDLMVYGAAEANDAATLLTEALLALPTVCEDLATEGIVLVKAEDVKRRGFYIKGKQMALWVADVENTADGLSKLVRVLRQSNERKKLEKAGIIPLLK